MSLLVSAKDMDFYSFMMYTKTKIALNQND